METKKLKYLLLTNHEHTQLSDKENCLRTGLYSWIPTMEGEVRLFTAVDKSEYENYDIIQVNLSTQDLHILGDVREVIGDNSKTKLVANNDYTLELWGQSFPYLSTLKREIQYADMIFGTEPYQVGALELLTGRKVHLITHPAFVKRLSTLKVDSDEEYISVISHRYDNNNVVPSLALKGLNYKTRLIGHDSNSDKNHYKTVTLYNETLKATNYMDFCDQLLDSKVVYDPFSLTSQGRVGWDCAAMGIPVVGSDRNESYRVCFPKTCVDPYDVKSANKLLKRLVDDTVFRDEVIAYAKEAVNIVSYDNSRKLYLQALEEGSPILEDKNE